MSVSTNTKCDVTPARDNFFQQKRTQLEAMSLIDIMSYIFPLASSYAVFDGVYKLLDSWFTSLIISVISFLFIASFYRSYLKWYPTSDARKKRLLLGPMVFFAVFAVFLTTPFSTAKFGGDIALRKDFERTIAVAETNGRTRLAALEAEQSLASALGSSSQEFDDLSKEESAGAFTGVSGHGSAAITFATVGQQLGRMKDTVAANEQKVETLKVEYEQDMRNLRTITYSHDSQKVRVTNFAQQLTDLNDVFNRMESASILPSVQQAAGSLSQVAGLQLADGDAAVAAKQTVTIAKAQTLVASIQRDINNAVKVHATSNQPMPPLKVMDESEAIFVYAPNIAWAWAVALTLDFAPMLFLYMLSVFNDTGKPKKRSKKVAPAVASTTAADQAGGGSIRHLTR